MQQRVGFYTIFKTHQDGSIEPLRVVRIGSVQMGPGVRLGKGVLFGSIDLSNFIGRDFLIEEREGVLIILGIF